MLPVKPSVTNTSTAPFRDRRLRRSPDSRDGEARSRAAAARRLDLLDALHLLDADVEQADGRAFDVEQDARHRRAHDREVDRCCASAPIEAPTSSTINSPRSVGHIAASAGRSISGSMRRQNFAIAISAPVLPAETAQSASPVLDRLDRAPHRRRAPPGAQRLARLVRHLDRDLAVTDFRALARAWDARRARGAISSSRPHSRKRDVGTALERDRGGRE